MSFQKQIIRAHRLDVYFSNTGRYIIDAHHWDLENGNRYEVDWGKVAYFSGEQ